MKITVLDEKRASDFLQLYEAAFPVDERREYADEADLLRFTREKERKFHAMTVEDEEGQFVGILTYWTFGGFVYIEHFAVSPELRGRNLGSRILRHLIDTVSGEVLLEVELPETEEARRRIRFYERNGFRTRDEFEYVQPPYSPGQQPLPLLIMTHGDVKLESRRDISEMLREVYNHTPEE